MIAILAPTKTMDFTRGSLPEEQTRPYFEDVAYKIIEALHAFDKPGLSDLMDISEQLADLTHQRIRNFKKEPEKPNSRQALFAYKGDVYANMQVDSYTHDQLLFAQDHLRILSGLYGILRPLDLIQPYRLEMQTPLSVDKQKDLYKFWGEQLSNALLEDIREQQTPMIINLTSNEYLKALPGKEIKKSLIDIDFKEFRDGQYKTIAIYSKKARGLMADFIIRHQIDLPEDLRAFDIEQYHFNESLSDEKTFVFTR